jgi:hypothetical protein
MSPFTVGFAKRKPLDRIRRSAGPRGRQGFASPASRRRPRSVLFRDEVGGPYTHAICTESGYAVFWSQSRAAAEAKARTSYIIRNVKHVVETTVEQIG